jgi:hypothetical protein
MGIKKFLLFEKIELEINIESKIPFLITSKSLGK